MKEPSLSQRLKWVQNFLRLDADKRPGDIEHLIEAWRIADPDGTFPSEKAVMEWMDRKAEKSITAEYIQSYARSMFASVEVFKHERVLQSN